MLLTLSVGVRALDPRLYSAPARSAGTRRSPGLSGVAAPWRTFGKSRHSAKRRRASARGANPGKWGVLMNSSGFLSPPGSAERRRRRQRRQQLRITPVGAVSSRSLPPLTPHQHRRPPVEARSPSRSDPGSVQAAVSTGGDVERVGTEHSDTADRTI